MQKTTTTVTPLALKDAPALIETVFPAQKVSFEAQKERKAGAGQTLTALGSYWKGRKPLILVRAIVLGSLLPPTDDAEADLAIFEQLMAFDDESLARRALAANAFSAASLQGIIPISDPERYFGGRSWRRDVTDDDKLVLYRQALAMLSNYEAKASVGKRPEEVDQEWLYAPVWPEVNRHYAHLGISAKSLPKLVEQLGILRYGHRPRVGDTFSGGGSIPFEAARIGCDVYATDLNPIACMLTWGALNIIGSSKQIRAEIEKAQKHISKVVDEEITTLGIEHDKHGNRAKAYLYCIEARCPETGWLVPIAPSWVVAKTGNVIARLNPNFDNKRFDIEIVRGASTAEMKNAEKGTLQNGELVYELNGKVFRTSIKTLRGDFRLSDGASSNRLRRWRENDFKPHRDDVFQERLYAIMWMLKDSLEKARPEIHIDAPTQEDLSTEILVDSIVAENLFSWQTQGLIPNMEIETGDKTEEPIRTRGWTYWHHLFSPRQLLMLALVRKEIAKLDPDLQSKVAAFLPDVIQRSAKLCIWDTFPGPGRMPKIAQVFSDQALNTPMNWGVRAWPYLSPVFVGASDIHDRPLVVGNGIVRSSEAAKISEICELYISDPPYADAVVYHEITEFFIAWLRKDPPKPFDEWVWDSRRALAIKGSGEDFRHGMVAAYKAMAEHMPENGMQCVMFTHQDTAVWGDLIGIFWAAGLQVVAAWYIATETTSGKVGAFVQGTVILILKKRAAGERTGFKQRLLPAVRQEVARQIGTMMHLNNAVATDHGEPVWGDSDLQMAGYAAALKVLTAYTRIGDEDVTAFALRPRARGEVTVVDEIVQQAAETASSLLVPEGLTADAWGRLTGIERFVLRMMDMETAGVAKLDNYQNFAKAFRVTDYTRVMGDMRPNNARLKRVSEYASRDLTDTTEIGVTRLGQLIIALQQRLKDSEAQVIVEQLRAEMADFLEVRSLLVDMLTFIERKAPESEVRSAAEVLGARLKNLRFGD